jgi:transcriptional/translational regulatory protein YebC/TACO1
LKDESQFDELLSQSLECQGVLDLSKIDSFEHEHHHHRIEDNDADNNNNNNNDNNNTSPDNNNTSPDNNNKQHFARILCELNELNNVRQTLTASFGEPQSFDVVWQPRDPIALADDDEEAHHQFAALIDDLEDCQDVQRVFHNVA